MYYISTRMQAFAKDTNRLQIEISKNYYGGNISTFYIRQHTHPKLQVIECNRTNDCADWVSYETDYEYDITENYDIIDQYGLTVVLQYRKLVTHSAFDSWYRYQGADLGCTYTRERTTWKVWSPTALSMLVKIQFDAKEPCYAMKKDKHGVFHITIDGDFDGYAYTYLVNHNGSYQEVLDPYSYSSIANSKASVVIDTTKCQIPMHRESLPVMNKQTEAVIYETSIRDFTSDANIHCRFPGKYVGMIEKGLTTKEGHPAGIDYLKYLGITHLQIMPMYDFATIEEQYPKAYYNWGYDPMQYNVPEGSFSTDSNSPYTRIIECKEMIAGLHKEGIRVVMDVVFNHMYDVCQTAFETLVPGYFFRRNSEGYLSNGSWCGNDTNTTASMVRKYLVDMAIRWQTFYGIDGLRFDLMGLLDIETIQSIHHACSAHDRSFSMYGEGWNIDTALSYDKRAIQENHNKISMIGFFNDMFRDKLKGNSDDGGIFDQGYFAGNMYNTDALCGCLLNTYRYTLISQSINYVECHDNATIFDKYKMSNAEESESVRKTRQKLLTITTLLAQGVPFLHSGQEWYRTKQGHTNSYCSGDTINQIDWSRVDAHWDDIEEIQQIIAFRKENTAFHYTDRSEIKMHTKVQNYHHQMVKYVVEQESGEYKKFIIYINASKEKHVVSLPKTYEILYNSTNMKEIVEISPLSMVILGLR